MEPTRLRCMLIVRDGPSRRVGPGGVLIGRQRDCDVVVDDPSISRRHALVRLTPDGAEVVPLGRTPIELNGKLRDRACALADGDALALPGLSLVVSIRVAGVDTAAPATYRLERARGGSFGVVHSPFVVGGGDGDDLIVHKWPAAALQFSVAQHELFVEVSAGTATKNGTLIEAGTLEALAAGDALTYRKETFVVRAAGAHDATTAVAGLADLPTKVVVEMLPRGGRVVFTVGDGERAVYFADRGLDLVAALLRPPTGYVAGDFVPDDVIRPIVWPRSATVSRPEINMLISRCRRVLVEAGLSGPRLLVRAPGGGATKLALAPGAEVSVA
jgi:hypothetical protein